MLTNNLYGIGLNGSLNVGPNARGATLFVNSTIGVDNRGRVNFPGSQTGASTGSAQGPQGNPTTPLATLAYALTLCAAGRGDTIVLQPNHAETLTVSVTCSLAGVNIIGLGSPGARPVFTMAGFSVVISGAGCLLQNCVFNMGTTANIVGGVQITGAGSRIDNCHIVGANVTSIGILLGAARATASNNNLDGVTTGFASGILTGVFDQMQIIGNWIHGIFAAANITLVASTNLLIQGNTLVQTSATVKPVINGIITATGGVIEDNRFQSVAATTAAEFLDGANVATNILVVYLQNYGFKGKAGPSSGILIPAVGTIP